MKMKKVLALALSLVMVSGLLAGCGSGDDTQGGSPDPISTENPSPTEDPGSIEDESEPLGGSDESSDADYTVNSDYVGVYYYDKDMGDGTIPWTLTLNEDGSFEIVEKNEMMGTSTWTGDKWVDNGDGTVTTPGCIGSENKFSSFWEDDSITWAILNENRTVPVKADEYNTDVEKYGLFSGKSAAASSSNLAGVYNYDKDMGDGSIPWTLTLNEDGSFEICEKNEMMGTFTWTGEQWVDNGDGTVTTPDCVGSDNKMSSFWEDDSITWAILNENRAVPVKAEEYNADVEKYGLFSGGSSVAASDDLAGEYSFVESTEFGDYTWVVTLNEDGSFEIVQKNPDMGNPTWTGEKWVDNGDGTFTTPDCQGDGPQLASFWKDSAITFTVNSDGTVTPVE